MEKISEVNPIINLILKFYPSKLEKQFCCLSLTVCDILVLKIYFTFILLILYVSVLFTCLSMHHMGTWCSWMPWDRSYKWLWANMWVLWIKLIRSSERSASGLAIFPAPCDTFLKYPSIIEQFMYLFADVRIKWVYDNSHY